MRIAHLIIAHKEPDQVERLVKRITHADCDVFIHLDKKTALAEFGRLQRQPRVQFIRDRQLIRWAGYSFTRAILTGIKEVLEAGDYDFINLMSGQEYPLQSMEALLAFLGRHPGRTFMSYETPDSPWWQQNMSRVAHYHSTDFQFKGQYLLQSWINRLLPDRTFPLGYALYGGNCSMYWTISRACAQYVTDFMHQHPEVERFARYTWAPDEFLIPTILLNSPLRDQVVNNNLRYIDWSQGGPNPKFLGTGDLPALRRSPAFFARKFDIRQDSRILDQLDDMIAQGENMASLPVNLNYA
ncbi:MAG: beta-1,6-N-acetylglucosaminyltransferase [Adhaeribacter sp.]